MHCNMKLQLLLPWRRSILLNPWWDRLLQWKWSWPIQRINGQKWMCLIWLRCWNGQRPSGITYVEMIILSCFLKIPPYLSCDPHIHAALKVLLEKTVATQNKPQPPVHTLREQLALLYAKMSRPGDDRTVIQDSWYIRKFLGLVKMKARKGKVSNETSLKLRLWHSSCWSWRLIFMKIILQNAGTHYRWCSFYTGRYI